MCKAHNLWQVVLSPGSRNAPFLFSFGQDPFFTSHRIVDERSAAFFALGIAQQSQKPVVLCCTSGTAALNYAPAIAEAYYQRVPLLVITADRPEEWIDQGEGQCIRQQALYGNYCDNSFHVPFTLDNQETIERNAHLLNNVFNIALSSPGPVHINIPLEEPLYRKTTTYTAPVIVSEVPLSKPPETDWFALRKEWLAHPKKMVLIGQMPDSPKLTSQLLRLIEDPSVAVVTETTANAPGLAFNGSIDRVLFSFEGDDEKVFAPDLLVTFGINLISKKIKSWLRAAKVKEHWHVDPWNERLDTFRHQTRGIKVAPEVFLQNIMQEITADSDFGAIWKKRDHVTLERHHTFLQSAPYSDLKAFHHLHNILPDSSQVQMGNSSVVRYFQLFPHLQQVKYFGNRGVSGIEGTTSTAVGAAIASPDQLVTLVTGDLAFQYDSNAFWVDEVPENLRVVIINNSGGGIFRIIQGPGKDAVTARFIEAHQEKACEFICRQHGMDYYTATSEEELVPALDALFGHERQTAAVLEIFTPREENDNVLKQYFKHIKS